MYYSFKAISGKTFFIFIKRKHSRMENKKKEAVFVKMLWFIKLLWTPNNRNALHECVGVGYLQSSKKKDRKIFCMIKIKHSLKKFLKYKVNIIVWRRIKLIFSHYYNFKKPEGSVLQYFKFLGLFFLKCIMIPVSSKMEVRTFSSNVE